MAEKIIAVSEFHAERTDPPVIPTAEGEETDIALLSVIRENLDAFLTQEHPDKK